MPDSPGFPPPIEDYALIGDCATAALVSNRVRSTGCAGRVSTAAPASPPCSASREHGRWQIGPGRSRRARPPRLPRWHDDPGDGVRDRRGQRRADRLHAALRQQFLGRADRGGAARAGEACACPWRSASTTACRSPGSRGWRTGAACARSPAPTWWCCGPTSRCAARISPRSPSSPWARASSVPFVLTQGPSHLAMPPPVDAACRAARRPRRSGPAGSAAAATRASTSSRCGARC